MWPLVRFVDDLRALAGPNAAIPDFDPWDGGVAAELLFVLEAPGPKAVASGFVSRNNPDETARNFFELTAAAGLPRERSVVWNIVPWYIGAGHRIRPAVGPDIASGWPHLLRLLARLPRLRAVVLVGRKAQRVSADLEDARPDLRRFCSAHPSPMFINRAPGNRALVQRELAEVARWLGW
jgi:uracil-DNA glycosylase